MSSVVVRISAEDNRRQYALEQMLVSILGLNVDFISVDALPDSYTIEYEGKSLSVLSSDVYNPQWTDNPWGPEDSIVAIYGGSTECTSQTDSAIVGLSLDLAMSAFFLLSRVEELNANADMLDAHGRFKASSSLAYKMGFIDRPMVNEYAEMVVRIFGVMGVQLPVNRQGEKLLYTHDVDILTYEPILKAMVGDIIKRHDLLSAIKRVRNLWYDEHDTFDALMDMSEVRNQKGTFNIMATHYDFNKPVSDNYLSKRAFDSMLNRLRARGHQLGFHPGYYTADNEEQWKRERMMVESRVQQALSVGRQHYLRVFVPRTLEIWEDNGMYLDSSLGFADRTGFRCGTGCIYHPYDFRTGKSMSLLEQPLVVMDTTLDLYESLSEKQKEERINLYISLSLKYSMPVTLLYHN